MGLLNNFFLTPAAHPHLTAVVLVTLFWEDLEFFVYNGHHLLKHANTFTDSYPHCTNSAVSSQPKYQPLQLPVHCILVFLWC